MIAIYVLLSTANNLTIWMEEVVALSLAVKSTLASIVFLICPVITLIIWWKIRKYGRLKDEFLFFFELKASGIIWILSVALTIGSALINEELVQNKCVILFLFCFSAIGPSLLSTVVIPLKIKHAIKKNELDFDLEQQIGRGYTVRGMFQDEQLFEKFIAWMIREFSGENILSFVEFVQFKQYVIKIKEEQTAAAVVECA